MTLLTFILILLGLSVVLIASALNNEEAWANFIGLISIVLLIFFVSFGGSGIPNSETVEIIEVIPLSVTKDSVTGRVYVALEKKVITYDTYHHFHSINDSTKYELTTWRTIYGLNGYEYKLK